MDADMGVVDTLVQTWHLDPGHGLTRHNAYVLACLLLIKLELLTVMPCFDRLPRSAVMADVLDHHDVRGPAVSAWSAQMSGFQHSVMHYGDAGPRPRNCVATGTSTERHLPAGHFAT